MNPKKWLDHPRIAHYRGSPRFWVFLSLSFFLAIAFWEVAEEIFLPAEKTGDLHRFDTAIIQLVSGFRNDSLTQIMTDLTSLGSFSVITVTALGVFFFLAYLRDLRGFLYLFTVLLGAVLWPLVLKPYFGRGRPEEASFLVKASGFSFPSGHSFGAACAYLAFAFLVSRYFSKLRQEAIAFSFAALLVSLVGISRIYLGVHYPSDVMGGICAGAGWTFFLSAIFIQLRKKAE